ncbi:hypothetical protein, partial [Delftia tsuruhatensis]|uniref:hypothetical protein n=1 Tax=Delftia tsuruhatensis TaxID=180282 RepID=UPI001EF5A76F
VLDVRSQEVMVHSSAWNRGKHYGNPLGRLALGRSILFNQLLLTIAMKNVCKECGAEFSRLKIWLGGELKCRVCHVKYVRKMTLTSFFFIGPLAWFAVWLGIWQKNPLAILVSIVSLMGYGYFCKIEKNIEYDDLLKNR